MTPATFSPPAPAIAESVRNMAQKVSTLLKSNPYEPVQRLLCECTDEVLVIRGRVPTHHQKRIVQMLLSEVARKVQVRDEVVVVSPSSR